MRLLTSSSPVVTAGSVLGLLLEASDVRHRSHCIIARSGHTTEVADEWHHREVERRDLSRKGKQELPNDTSSSTLA